MSRTDAITVNSEAAIWERVIQPERSDLNPEAARSILQLSFAENDRNRMHELALKGQEGKLTPDEAAQLDNYRRIGRLLELMQSKARLSLRNSGAPT